MKLRKITMVLAFLFMFIFAGAVIADAEFSPEVYTFGSENYSDTRINAQLIGDEKVIVMPSSQSPDSIRLYADFKTNVVLKGDKSETVFQSGEAINLNDLCSGDDYRLWFVYKHNGRVYEYDLRILFSENISSIYIISDNPAEKGREWVEASADKSNKATGRISVIRPDGTRLYGGNLTQIKGRGNSTWTQDKKPYQIKISDSVDMLESGNEENKSKTWVLLANYFDTTLLNNSTALGMGKVLGMEMNIESIHADLYYDGEYRGAYLLSEKVETGDGRVDIADLAEENEAVNEGVDIEDLPVNTATTENGAVYTYCEGMSSPADITGGYLLEMDFEVRAKEEVCYFKTTRNQYVVVKSPEYASKEEMDYIATLYQEYEDAVYNGGVNPSTGKHYYDYVDKESIASYYIVNEISKAKDFFSSSAYLYKASGEDKMYMGPLWDYDLSFGKSRIDSRKEDPPYGENIYNTDFGRKLIQISDFAQTVNSLYEEKLYPFVKNVLLGDEYAVSDDGVFRSLIYEKKCLEKATECNNIMWNNNDEDNLIYFLSERADFLKNSFELVTKREPGKVYYYGDVSESDWFYNDVTEVTAAGYMTGAYNSFFDPYFNAMRYEVAQSIFYVSGEDVPDMKKVFEDVGESGSGGADAIVWAYEKGIMNGYPGGYFYPDNFITREEVATVLYRYIGEPSSVGEISEDFVDREDVSEFAKDAVSWALQSGILKGDDNSRINPKGNITRAELAVVINRISKL